MNHKPQNVGASCSYNFENFPNLIYKYICFMGFMMITQHNALWDDAFIHCDFNTLQSKMKIIIATYNI
jgi:hypothetical protein